MGLSALTVKPLLIALALSIAGLLLSNVGWWAHAAVLEGQRDVAREAQATLAVSRDAFKVRTEELSAANRVYDAEYARLAKELEFAQGEADRLSREGEQAVAAAQAKAAESDRVLHAFMDRYAQQIRAPDCAQALSNMQRFCPALEGY